jgi:hypothetical protein
MIIYVNGDSHTAAAEAVNSYAFAEDDPNLFYMGRAPHPENWRAGWAHQLGQLLKCPIFSDAESAASNARILRTTREWIATHPHLYKDMVMMIQWSTWEREEWLHEGTWLQVGSSGIDDVPPSLQEKYRNFVIGTDWEFKTQQAHQEIWQLHQELQDLGIRHVFFNGNNHFGKIPESEKKDWGINYIDPYQAEMTYDQWLRRNGFDTVAPNSWHFGQSAHAAWCNRMLQYCIDHNLVT